MGLSFSHSALATRCSPRGQSEPSLDASVLQQPLCLITKLINTYLNHGYPPIADIGSLRNLILVAASGDQQLDVDMLVDVLWLVYEHDKNQVCYIQEVLTVLVLLCQPNSTMGAEVMYHEDIMMAVQVVSSTNCKLWNLEQTFDFDELTRLSEAIADHAFNKLNRDIEEGISREMFLSWGTDRFKETALISDFNTLAELYEMPY